MSPLSMSSKWWGATNSQLYHMFGIRDVIRACCAIHSGYISGRPISFPLSSRTDHFSHIWTNFIFKPVWVSLIRLTWITFGLHPVTLALTLSGFESEPPASSITYLWAGCRCCFCCWCLRTNYTQDHNKINFGNGNLIWLWTVVKWAAV